MNAAYRREKRAATENNAEYIYTEGEEWDELFVLSMKNFAQLINENECGGEH